VRKTIQNRIAPTTLSYTQTINKMTEIKMFTKKEIIIGLSVVAISAGTTGCQWSIGKTEMVQPTIGEELIGLMEAKNVDAINENEYNKKKRQFLNAKPGTRPSGWTIN